MNKQKRTGETLTTSVSVSKEFQKIIDKYKFSPTEVFRRGMAVMLYDAGDLKYKTALNKKRSEFVKEFLKEMKENERLAYLFEEIVKFSEIIKDAKEE